MAPRRCGMPGSAPRGWGPAIGSPVPGRAGGGMARSLPTSPPSGKGPDPELFSTVQAAPAAGGQVLQIQWAAPIHQVDGDTQQPQRGQAHRRGHPSHLPVTTLAHFQLQPAGRHLQTMPDRWLPLRPARIRQAAHPCRQGQPALKLHAPAQTLQGLLAGDALHLHVVATPVPPARIGEAMLQSSIGGQQQQALAVGIEPTGGIDSGDGNVGGQGLPATAGLRAELAENAVGLVEQDRRQGSGRGGDAGGQSRGVTVRLVWTTVDTADTTAA